MTQTIPATLSTYGAIAANIALVIVTWWYTRATRAMAEVMRKDYVARNTPVLDVGYEYALSPDGRPFTCVATVWVINKGGVPTRVEKVLIRVGSAVKSQKDELILGIGEKHPIDARLTAKDFVVERLETGERAELVAEVRYIGIEGRQVTKKVTLPYPWGKRPSDAATPDP